MKDNEKTTVTNDYCESYEELKKQLKEKYSLILKSIIESANNKVESESNDILGKEFFDLHTEAEVMTAEIKTEKEEFYKSENYTAAQADLAAIKAEIDKCDDEDEKKNLNVKLDKAMAKISTLNITINNRLKSKTEELEAKVSAIGKIVGEHRKEIERLRDEIVNFITTSVASTINEFNADLTELNDIFGVEQSSPELPFDEKELKMQFIDLPFEKYVTPTERREGRTIIKSVDNMNNVKN